jgi:hypothetical protein
MSAGARSEHLIPVDDWSEVPSFESEGQEAEYWRTHCLGQPLLNQMGPINDGSLPPPRLRTRRVETQITNALRLVPIQPLMRRQPGRPKAIELSKRPWLHAS